MERLDIDQQQIGVEDEHKRQQGGSDIVGKALNASLDRIATADCRRCEGGEADRRRIVGEDAEIEHKHMRGDQWHHQARLRPHNHDHRRHQRRDHNVVRGGRQAHAQQQAHHRHQQQHDHQAAA